MDRRRDGGKYIVVTGMHGVMEARHDEEFGRMLYCPPFRALTAEEERKVCEKIRASRADVVWVGLSTPKQERWMARHREALGVPVMVGVGAAFDFHTGRVAQAPRWMREHWMEWFFGW